MFNPYDVVYTVLITEKATALSEKFHRYTIKVNPRSNKIEIRKAVEAIFEICHSSNLTFECLVQFIELICFVRQFAN